VRHGCTRLNHVGLVMGWADERSSLSSTMPDAAAARLAAAPAPVRVVSSPIARARDTAAPLAAALTVTLENDPRLGELHQGPWQGLAETEVARRWPLEWSMWRTAPQTLDLDGRETLTALYARVADAFDDFVRSPGPASRSGASSRSCDHYGPSPSPSPASPSTPNPVSDHRHPRNNS